jgi:hypothetical protein
MTPEEEKAFHERFPGFNEGEWKNRLSYADAPMRLARQYHMLHLELIALHKIIRDARIPSPPSTVSPP